MHLPSSPSGREHEPNPTTAHDQQPASRSTRNELMAASLSMVSLLPSARSSLRRYGSFQGRNMLGFAAALAVLFSPHTASAQKESPAQEHVVQDSETKVDRQLESGTGAKGKGPKDEGANRKNWTSHVSASFNQRRYTLIGYVRPHHHTHTHTIFSFYVAMIIASTVEDRKNLRRTHASNGDTHIHTIFSFCVAIICSIRYWKNLRRTHASHGDTHIHTIFSFYVAIIIASTVYYWKNLRAHMPVMWALPFCLFVFIVGLLVCKCMRVCICVCVDMFYVHQELARAHASHVLTALLFIHLHRGGLLVCKCMHVYMHICTCVT
jgi:hypothetical protein